MDDHTWTADLVDSRSCGQQILWTADLVDSRSCGQQILWTADLVDSRSYGHFPFFPNLFTPLSALSSYFTKKGWIRFAKFEISQFLTNLRLHRIIHDIFILPYL